MSIEDRNRRKMNECQERFARQQNKLSELKHRRSEILNHYGKPDTSQDKVLETVENQITLCEKEINRIDSAYRSLKLNLPYALVCEILGWSLSKVKHEAGVIKSILTKYLTTGKKIR